MRTLLNVIWLVFGGFWLAIGYAVFGLVACLFIVTIPFGVASLRMARYALWPFGSAVVAKPGAGAGSVIGNAVWFVVAGVWLAVAHVLTALAQGVTIVGIPVALANLKMIPVTCFPFGKDIVPRSMLAPGQRPLHSF
ncbi:MAG: YccF domain-containing protein [Propionibacteriaceae bacterium]